MIDSTRTDLPRPGTEQPPAGARRRRRPGNAGTCLPSEQVREELVRLGPDLTTIVDDLRNRLNELDPAPGR